MVAKILASVSGKISPSCSSNNHRQQVALIRDPRRLRSSVRFDLRQIGDRMVDARKQLSRRMPRDHRFIVLNAPGENCIGITVRICACARAPIAWRSSALSANTLRNCRSQSPGVFNRKESH